MNTNTMPSPEAWAEASNAPTLNLEQMETLIANYKQARNIYDAAKKESDDAYHVTEEIKQVIISELMKAQKTSYKSEHGTVTITSKSTVKVPASVADRKKLFAYMQALGDDFVWSKFSVNSQSLNSWYNELKESAGDSILEIPGINESSTMTNLTFRK